MRPQLYSGVHRVLDGKILIALFVLALAAIAGSLSAQERKTARELGVVVGVLPAGPNNAITDVPGVKVGQVTITRGDTINTGVTVILPHSGNLFREKVPAAAVVGNGFGKLAGFTQIQELGDLETPIALTCTLCVPKVADALMAYTLGLPGNEDVRSVNAVVGETNDGYLNNIRLRPVTEADVFAAIAAAREGPVEQGSVGAGRGTQAFGWKGGIGTSSRRLPQQLGGWTLGVLVQSNYGGILTVNGAPVGKELGSYYLKNVLSPSAPPAPGAQPAPRGSGLDGADGSIMMVVATDAPIEHFHLERLARRALSGLARTGSSMSNGSGDYVLSFSTVTAARRAGMPFVTNEQLSPLFEATIEATEEAIYNSMFMATTVKGHQGTVRALPLDSAMAVIKRYGAARP